MINMLENSNNAIYWIEIPDSPMLDSPYAVERMPNAKDTPTISITNRLMVNDEREEPELWIEQLFEKKLYLVFFNLLSPLFLYMRQTRYLAW
jgi:hypothetical protein